ncbi:MAG: pro-sigmaK processing inhibitor BofA family protein [Clostridia bacterium]|nr:pro-sigmaK processing inhibitor BofA family protein [Clostridia bacterium]
MGINTVPFLFAGICVITMTITMLRRKCLIKGILSSAVQGVAALYAVNLVGLITGTHIAVNWLSLGTAAVLGSPGAALILVVQTVFNT